MLIGALAQYFFGFTIFVLSSFLVLLVLVQRGRGGGLTGALGGPGGQSAFGTKAGDLFTRITVGVATAWILLCATAVFMLKNRALPQTGSADRPAAKGNAVPGAAGATSGTTENSSTTPKIDFSNLSMPTSGLPDLKSPATTPAATESTTPAATEPATPAAAEATSPATPAAASPATETTPPVAPTGTETPPEPK